VVNSNASELQIVVDEPIYNGNSYFILNMENTLAEINIHLEMFALSTLRQTYIFYHAHPIALCGLLDCINDTFNY